jgi:hypothetical protein
MDDIFSAWSGESLRRVDMRIRRDCHVSELKTPWAVAPLFGPWTPAPGVIGGFLAIQRQLADGAVVKSYGPFDDEAAATRALISKLYES